MILEACVDSIQQAMRAERKGADQIELCSKLDQDGLTPDLTTFNTAIKELTIPIKPMIRARSGTFILNELDLQEMKKSILYFNDFKCGGYVLGCMTADGKVDSKALEYLLKYTLDIPITFHKAIDQSVDILESTKILSALGIDFILSSGGHETALEGSSVLKEMQIIGDGKTQIIAAGKITKKNLNNLHQKLAGKYYHGRKIVGDLD